MFGGDRAELKAKLPNVEHSTKILVEAVVGPLRRSETTRESYVVLRSWRHTAVVSLRSDEYEARHGSVEATRENLIELLEEVVLDAVEAALGFKKEGGAN